MTAREPKGRRLLRDLAAHTKSLLACSPRDPGYAQAYRRVASTLEEVSVFLGPSTPRNLTRKTRIDVPNSEDLSLPWVVIGTYPRAEAVSLMRQVLGADEKGRICLLSDAGDDEGE